MNRARQRRQLRIGQYDMPLDKERWLVSYADFITLLFAFFVVMYAISSINLDKYRELAQSLTGEEPQKIAKTSQKRQTRSTLKTKQETFEVQRYVKNLRNGVPSVLMVMWLCVILKIG